MSSLEWRDWCCIACRRQRRTITATAESEEPCLHTGTAVARPFWRAAGEPNEAVLADDAARKEWALHGEAAAIARMPL